jgi:hypothetical protein
MMPRSGTVCLLLMLAMALTSLTKRMRRSLSLSGGYLQSVTKILRGEVAAHGISLTQTVWLKGDVVRLQGGENTNVCGRTHAACTANHQDQALYLRWSFACK